MISLSNILDKVNKSNDIKNISPRDYEELAYEIRRFLVTKVNRTGGHLASNLGVVELTMALHLYLSFPNDKLIWDVGHQSYVHKILTGRKEAFETLRQFGGLSGFPKRKESDSDAFDTGHSSTSISIANGIAKARDLNGETKKVVAVIGDGALSGGMAYEALNNIARMKTNLMIVLNDNNMSISENVGGMANYLGKVRTSLKYTSLKGSVETTLRKVPMLGEPIVDKIRKSKASIKQLFIPGMLFEDMGLTYIGPIDGHNIDQMLTAFTSASKVNGPVIVHVITKKGKGYKKAELNPSEFHGIEPFSLTAYSLTNTEKTYTQIFAETMTELIDTNGQIVAITAAMRCGTGLDVIFRKYPKRCFDVGIAEEHAVTFAAGLSVGGYHPVVAIYSTFLQRSYDQILHDVCIGNLPVTFVVDRSGIVGSDGETHQGIFDTSFLAHIPGLSLLAPKNGDELRKMLFFAVSYQGPTAIKFPRGMAYNGFLGNLDPIEYGKSEVIHYESEIALLFVGNMGEAAVNTRNKLKESGKSVTLVNVRFISPMDTDMLKDIAENHKVIVTLEENIKCGGFGEMAAAFLLEQGYGSITFINISLPEVYLEHGTQTQLREAYGMDADSIVEKILKIEV